MKLSVLILTLTCLTIAKTTDEDLQNRAAAQLTRLSAFRRTKEPQTQQPDNATPIEADPSAQELLSNPAAMKRIDELAQAAYNFYKDPNYEAMMQRIKRSGSGDFVSGIASKVVGGVVSASGGLSQGSFGGSSGPQVHDSYGAPAPPYGKQFSIFDFKKAILNTVIQALKALAGGALALKGQLIKGGGFLVQTKGRVISSAGEAISSLGAQIASSAVISAPKPVYGAPYAYDPPHTQDVSYDGPPPPNAEASYQDQEVYHHGHYGSPSSEDQPTEQHEAPQEPGLLVVKETKPEEPQDVHQNLISNDQSSQSYESYPPYSPSNPPPDHSYFSSNTPQNDAPYSNTPPQNSGSYSNTPPQNSGSYSNTPPQDSGSYSNTPPQNSGSYSNTPPQSHAPFSDSHSSGTLEDSFGGDPRGNKVTKLTGTISGTIGPIPQSNAYYDTPPHGHNAQPTGAASYQTSNLGNPNDNGLQISHQQALQEIQHLLSPHLSQAIGQSVEQGSYQGSYQGFGGFPEDTLKPPVYQNGLDPMSMAVFGLQGPLQGVDFGGHAPYNSWKRYGSVQRRKKGTAYRRYRRDPKRRGIVY